MVAVFVFSGSEKDQNERSDVVNEDVLKAKRRNRRLVGTALFAVSGLVAIVACKHNRVELGEVWSTGADGADVYARFLPIPAVERPTHDRGPKPTSLDDTRRELDAEAARCRGRIEAAMEAPALPGAPRLEAHRGLVLARAKAEPVLFVEAPSYVGEVSPGTRARRKAIESTEFPRDMLQSTIATFRDFPERLRQLVLRDGYLYTDDPRTARLLTQDLSFEKLFNEDELVLHRGSERLAVERGKEGYYVLASGRQEGQRARLLLFDRVWIKGQEPGPPLHLDVREFTQRQGIEGMRIVRLGVDSVVAEVRFGDEWVPALIERAGVKLSLGCTLIEADEMARVGRARDEAYRRTLVLDALRRAIAEQVRLGLPFDEPRTERGQQDGKLRAKWEQAYFGSKETYKFNGDTYSVYSAIGAPIAPQVCIDFVTETVERASGMHFAPRSQKPHKILGALNFDELLEGSRRQEMALRNYARTNPHRLSLIDYPMSQWVRYEKIDPFFEFLEQNKEDLMSGDIVVIRGRGAWDRYREVHTHTFFIYESDPITGMPMLIAGNAGKPRISSWDDEMLRAPKRSIRHRIRPNMEWLYDHVVLRAPLRGEQWASPISLAEL